ncbi:MAG: SRPBCC family protein [Nitrospira sp.]
MITIIPIVIALLIATILAYAATKPDTFRIQRTIRIAASQEQIFPHINNLTQWAAWSPWEKMDPAMKKTASGPPQGKGAIYEWDGNNQVGKGRMEILESVPPAKILIKLDFLKPFEAHNQAEFTLTPQEGVTTVTWAMYGPQPYMAKVMGLVFNCEKMVGPQFETGLANLKTLAEQ